MTPLRPLLFVLAPLAATVLPASGVGAAEETITVRANMARVLRIEQPAATVIIGNPGVADVTIQDPSTLVLTGKSYGETNLIILDTEGEPVADVMVEVVQASSDVVTVYQGAQRTTLSCSPVCQPTITLGDDSGFTSSTVSSSKLLENAGQ